ncbi:hypothetical protein NC651_016035 [Populus alba x Populus x berolinensis]|nr:hypothetical protein NC651_016035 [Populus alba x Populus x berolinensis]
MSLPLITEKLRSSNTLRVRGICRALITVCFAELRSREEIKWRNRHGDWSCGHSSNGALTDPAVITGHRVQQRGRKETQMTIASRKKEKTNDQKRESTSFLTGHKNSGPTVMPRQMLTR